MKRFLLKRDGNGGCEAIAEECKTPTPSAGEVLVKIEACSLNYRDLLVKSGLSASGGGGDVVGVGAGNFIRASSPAHGSRSAVLVNSRLCS